MASGQQLAEENYQTFLAWISAKSVDDFRAMVGRGVLSREEIAKECSFAKSSLSQNPRIKGALRVLEDRLREQGVLPLPVTKDPLGEAPVRPPGVARAGIEAERLRRLEQENASLKSEVGELKRRLAQYAVLQEALATTGRLIR